MKLLIPNGDFRQAHAELAEDGPRIFAAAFEATRAILRALDTPARREDTDIAWKVNGFAGDTGNREWHVEVSLLERLPHAEETESTLIPTARCTATLTFENDEAAFDFGDGRPLAPNRAGNAIKRAFLSKRSSIGEKLLTVLG